jgi:periplasmic divalent cation tolerance protein
MAMMVVLTTFGSHDKALEVGKILVEEELAACVNVLPEVRSIYRWKGRLEDEGEVLCLIKTTADGFERLRARLVELHPYEVPEVIGLPIEAGHQPYLDWLANGVRSWPPK